MGESMTEIDVKITVVEGGKQPAYQTAGAAGLDLCSAETDRVWIDPGEIAMISTKIFLEIPEGFEGQVRTRSGLGSKGIFVINSPGTLDSDYRGEVRVLLANFASKPFKVNPGDRIAQLVFSPVIRANLINTDKLSKTERGDGGFGSTGVK